MRKFNILLGVMIWGGMAAAQVQDFSPEAFENEVVHFKPLEGYHFELAADQSCESANVVSKEKNEISCQFLKTGTSNLVFNICDDKKTRCKTNALTLTVVNLPKGKKPEPLRPGLVEMKEQIHKQLLSGFVEGNYQELKAKAKEAGKPVFLMISTDWCSSCNQAKEYLIGTKAFEEFSKGLFKAYVDGDSQVSASFEKEVPFQEYPSFILLNSDFQEISRFRQDLTMASLKAWWERVSPYLNSSYSEVRKKVLARLAGDWLQRSKDFLTLQFEKEQKRDLEFVLESALAKRDGDFLQKISTDQVPEFLMSSWLDQRKEDLIAKGMSEEDYKLKVLNASRDSSSFPFYLMDICGSEKNKEICKTETEKLKSRAGEILDAKDQNAAEKLGRLAEEYYAQMKFYESQGDKKKTKNLAKDCAETFEKMISFSSLKTPRFASQGMLACAKEYDLSLVEKVYRKLVEKYPEDPTFLQRYSRFLMSERKNLDQAKVWAKRAMEASYDFNWFGSAWVYVEVLKKMGQKDQAKDVIKNAYARLKLDGDKDSRSQTILQRIRKLEADLRTN
ncbi:MAG TPA: hypothetical protein DCL41_05915 [Bdellovibrionales bacterium]|nr:hypothetical protein [Bdellovibrionales bacterium]|tara:strand:- start:13030 stop:14712 length:1683 start_codon:yes stop_codon:yes gene_type:complete